MAKAIPAAKGNSKSKKPQKISPEDLAAGIYPEGDIRNRPDVRAWMAEMQAAREARAALPPAKVENFEQRMERLHWQDWADALQKRLKRQRYEGAYELSAETREKLFEALEAVKADLDVWLT